MEDLHKLAKDRQLDALEAAWMERLERDEPGYEELLTLADYVARRVDDGLAGVLLWALVTSAEGKRGPVAALGLARRAAEILPRDTTLRQELGRLYAAAHADIEAMPALVQRSGLTGEAPIGRACDTLDLWAAMKPGTYVITRNSRRVALVERFDVAEGKAVFREPRGMWQMDLEAAVREMDRLDQDDLRALAAFEGERLRRMAQEDPVAVVKLALNQARDRRLEFRDLKQALVPGAVPAEGWTEWWKAARPLLVRAPHVEVSAASQPTLTLREVGLSYEDEMAQRFAAAADPAQALKVALDYAREQASSGRTAPHVEAGMAERLRQMAQARGAEALAAASVWDRLCEVSGDAAGRAEIDAAVSAMGGLAQRLAQIEDDSIARRAAALVRRVLPDGWGAVFEQAMLMAPLKRCESLGRELADAGPEALNRVAATVLADRDRCPEAFAWLWRIVAEGRPDAPAGLDPTDLTLAFLILAARLLRAGSGLSDDQARSVRGAVKTVLSGNDYAAVRRVIEGCSPDAARRLRMAVLNNRGLTDDGREVLDNALLSAHPDVFVEVKQPWEDEAVIWTTQEGMAKRRAALERLMDVEMPANARAVGEAAAKGDLSENAEWTAAIEERNLLAKRAETIQEELRRARVIPHDMANQETVTVGSRVRVRNLSAGREDNFVFLGPWDVDVEHGVYDYRAPLSRAFMGKRSGDRVAAGEGDQRREFEVLAVESAV